jgi:hypothetical protein
MRNHFVIWHLLCNYPIFGGVCNANIDSHHPGAAPGRLLEDESAGGSVGEFTCAGRHGNGSTCRESGARTAGGEPGTSGAAGAGAGKG